MLSGPSGKAGPDKGTVRLIKIIKLISEAKMIKYKYENQNSNSKIKELYDEIIPLYVYSLYEKIINHAENKTDLFISILDYMLNEIDWLPNYTLFDLVLNMVVPWGSYFASIKDISIIYSIIDNIFENVINKFDYKNKILFASKSIENEEGFNKFYIQAISNYIPIIIFGKAYLLYNDYTEFGNARKNVLEYFYMKYDAYYRKIIEEDNKELQTSKEAFRTWKLYCISLYNCLNLFINNRNFVPLIKTKISDFINNIIAPMLHEVKCKDQLNWITYLPMHIKSLENNLFNIMDFYSITYFKKINESKKEEHKLFLRLIKYPSCMTIDNYYSFVNFLSVCRNYNYKITSDMLISLCQKQYNKVRYYKIRYDDPEFLDYISVIYTILEHMIELKIFDELPEMTGTFL